MPLPTFKSEHTGNPVLDRIQGNIRLLVAALKLIPFLTHGKLVSVHFAAAGAQQIVHHGLGIAAACMVVRWNYAPGMAGPTFAEWVPQPTTIDPLKDIALVASATCTVDLWFYPRSSKALDALRGQSL